MKIKTILVYIITLALSLSLVGCGLFGSLRATRTEISNNFEEELPEWLTVAHRVQAAERPDTDTGTEESKEDDNTTLPVVNQPVATQPGSTQPVQIDEQQTPATGTPRWKQPGTMEYIAKQQLDQLVYTYKKLNSDLADLESEKNKDEEKLKALKKDREERYETMGEIAGSIGLSLDREYGIKPPPVETEETTTDSTWFHNWEQSPSGFGN
ncbi:MAG: hypothetical protein FJ152_09320 [Firmicutes bacterium]|nr:hypothetical protein [Bacillota bacterium]